MNTPSIVIDFASLPATADSNIAHLLVWTGAPLHYHEEIFTPAQLDAAWERWKEVNGHFGSVSYSHMWHRDRPRATDPTPQHHDFAVFIADTRCGVHGNGNPEHVHAPFELPGKVMTQVICERCQWHAIERSHNRAIERWHDHAFPGWRELPVIPRPLAEHGGVPERVTLLTEWINEYYPTSRRTLGSPTLVERGPAGVHHVPGRSPWGGFELTVPSLSERCT